ncbi:MAG: polyphosphate polymerase domain-containing protein [Flavobacteriales bacterium]|nr:polyphosphate polymerase domain-containing protein [Flavobacteriales bacterium]
MPYKVPIELTNTITLDEMDSVKLLNRKDTKFGFSAEIMDELIIFMAERYRSLVVEEKTATDYHTLYYDTPNFKFYLDHHNKRVNRGKVRFRRYGEKDCYLETKLKNNKDRTIKKRKKKKSIPFTLSEKSQSFVNETLIDVNAEDLIPQTWVHYKRMTFVNLELKERITLDIDLRYEKVDLEGNVLRSIETPSLMIAEAKQDGLSKESYFIQFMREKKIQETGLSKYCMATFLLNEEIKQNRFKKKRLFLDKLHHGNY